MHHSEQLSTDVFDPNFFENVGSGFSVMNADPPPSTDQSMIPLGTPHNGIHIGFPQSTSIYRISQCMPLRRGVPVPTTGEKA
jgi:hypothetical protein